MRAQSLSLFAGPWTVAHQAPLSMEFSKQEYWSGLPLPPPEDLPNPGIKPTSNVSPRLAGGLFTTEPPGKHLPLKVKVKFPVLGLIAYWSAFPYPPQNLPAGAYISLTFI